MAWAFGQHGSNPKTKAHLKESPLYAFETNLGSLDPIKVKGPLVAFGLYGSGFGPNWIQPI